MNLHTPERHPDETRADYRERQEASRTRVRFGHINERRTRAWEPTDGIELIPGSQRNVPNSRERFRRDRDFSKRIRFADALMAHWAAKRLVASRTA